MAVAALATAMAVTGAALMLWPSKPPPPTDFAEVIYQYDPALIQQNGEKDRILTVLIPFDRTRFFLVEGEPKGFEYDLVQAFAQEFNKNRPSNQPELKTVFLPTPFNQLLPLLESGVGDLAAGGLTVTEERKAMVDFTDPYIKDVREVLVLNSSLATTSSFEDLADAELYLAAGSSYVEHAKTLNEERSEAGLDPIAFVEGDPSLMSEDLLEMVNAGIIDGTVVDHHIAELWQTTLANIVVSDLAVAEGTEIAWAIPKADAPNSSPALREALNRFIEDSRKGTLLGNILFDRYYETRKWIDNPLTVAGIEQLETYRGLLERYGEQYGFDWKLLAALVFQESRFDPKATSSRGARGLMQLMPATAEELGFDNLSDPETNIHAGTKYLAFLRDRYFSDENLDPFEREKLTLAAYNAGPARVRKLREMARDMGRDPDRWFNHVERAAQRAIGDETVRYVANINKYRIAYGLSEAVLAEREAATQ